jgi:DivIVA domain-containing protein
MGNSPPSFTIVLRGYDRREVDRAVDQVLSAAGRVAEPPRFPVALRGYARNEVDAWFRSAAGSVPGAAG